MGIWIEMGVFSLGFLFALHQGRDLKNEKRKREEKLASADEKGSNPSDH